MTKEKGGGGKEGVNVMSDKLTTGRVKVRKDSCITQKCTGIAISLGFMSCKEMGRDRKPRLHGREVVLHYYLEGSSFSASTFTSSLPFLPPHPEMLLMTDLHTSEESIFYVLCG